MNKSKSDTSRVHKKPRTRKAVKIGKIRAQPHWRQVQRIRVPEDERQAMFTSLMHFLHGSDETKKEQLYRLIRNEQPALFQKLIREENIAATELLDSTVHGIGNIIYERDMAPEVEQVPQPEVSYEMKKFNKINVQQLSPERYAELTQLCKSCVPSLLLKSGKHRIGSPTLPDGVQIMMHKYLKKHLAAHEQLDPATYDPHQFQLEDDMDWWEDIILEYLTEQKEEKQRAKGKV